MMITTLFDQFMDPLRTMSVMMFIRDKRLSVIWSHSESDNSDSARACPSVGIHERAIQGP